MVYGKQQRKDRQLARGISRRPLGIFSWFGYDIPMKERLQAIRKAGFQATSVWWAHFENIGADYRDVPAMVRDVGLELNNIHLSNKYCNLFWCDSDLVRNAVVKQYICWLDECVKQAVDTVVMHVTTGSDVAFPTSDGVEAFRQVVKAAEQRKIVLAVENVRMRAHLDLVFAEIESQHLAFCYDSSHDRAASEDHPWLLRWLGNRLAVTHLSDSDGVEYRHWLPGNGVVNWAKIAEVFPRDSYAGAIHLEVLPTEAEKKTLSPDAFLIKAYEKATWLAGMLGEAKPVQV